MKNSGLDKMLLLNHVKPFINICMSFPPRACTSYRNEGKGKSLSVENTSSKPLG